MYCIECEMGADNEFVLEYGHHFTDMRWDDWEVCFGPFTYSAPPELEENWQDNLIEPSDEEWTKINLNANELLMDLVGLGV